MATDRDLTFRILTTAETSALDETARALDDVAQAGTAAAADLDKLDTGAFDKLGAEAKAAATTVDTAMDKVGTSAKTSLAKVDDGTDKAKAGFKDMKEEAGQTARESAASFSDVTSALDAVQEIAANAFVGFGPAGLIAGAAAASGIGLVFSSLQTAAEKANEAKDRVIALAQAIRDAGGDMTKVDIPGMFADWAFAIGDNKSWWELWQTSNTTNLEIFRDKADAAGISVKQMFDAMAGNNPQALATALDELTRKLDDNTAARERAAALAKDDVTASNRAVANLANERDALVEARQAILDKAGETEAAIQLEADAAEALGRKTKAEEEATAAVQAHADAVNAFVEPAGVYTQLLTDKETAERESAQATAAATEDQSDSWADYADDVKVSVDEYLDELERQVKAQEQWATNLARLARRGVNDGVLAELERLGPEGAPLVAELTTASDKELKRLVALFGRQGAAASTAAGQGIVDGKSEVTGAAATVWESARRIFGQPVDIPVGVRAPSRGYLTGVRNDIAAGMGPIVVDVVVNRSDVFYPGRRVP